MIYCENWNMWTQLKKRSLWYNIYCNDYDSCKKISLWYCDEHEIHVCEHSCKKKKHCDEYEICEHSSKKKKHCDEYEICEHSWKKKKHCDEYEMWTQLKKKEALWWIWNMNTVEKKRSTVMNMKYVNTVGKKISLFYDTVMIMKNVYSMFVHISCEFVIQLNTSVMIHKSDIVTLLSFLIKYNFRSIIVIYYWID